MKPDSSEKEIDALYLIATTLGELDEAAQDRVLEYVAKIRKRVPTTSVQSANGNGHHSVQAPAVEKKKRGRPSMSADPAFDFIRRRGGTATISELATEYNLTPSGMRQRMHKLKQSGLVETDGKGTYFVST